MMILFIRTEDNNNLFSIEIWNEPHNPERHSTYTEVSTYIDIEEYSWLLMNAPIEQKIKIIGMFTQLQELDGWVKHVFFQDKLNDGTHKNDVIEELRDTVKNTAEILNLYYLED